MTKVIQMAKFILDKIENIVGKEENAGYQHFLLFPKCFQKVLSSRSLKVGIVWWRFKDTCICMWKGCFVIQLCMANCYTSEPDRHHNSTLVYVHASVHLSIQICQDHNFYIYGWISKYLTQLFSITLYQTTKVWTQRNWKYLQMTKKM